MPLRQPAPPTRPRGGRAGAPHAPAAAPRRGRRERGSVTTEMVLYTPLLMLLLTAGVQFVLWGWAQLAAQHAATHAVQATRVAGGTPAAGQADAAAVLDRIAPTALQDRRVSARRGPDGADVLVEGHAIRLLPLIPLPVRAHAHAPVEAFRPGGTG